MRIAIAGSHATGKSTLIAALHAQRPEYVVIDEAFYDFPHLGAELSVADLEAQAERSLELIHHTTESKVFFDRSPVDYLAYMQALDPESDLAPWLESARAAIATIDLIVFVPIESPDRIEVPASEYPRLRKQVDHILRDALIDDSWGIGCKAVEVTGSVEQRVKQVIGRLR